MALGRAIHVRLFGLELVAGNFVWFFSSLYSVVVVHGLTIAGSSEYLFMQIGRSTDYNLDFFFSLVRNWIMIFFMSNWACMFGYLPFYRNYFYFRLWTTMQSESLCHIRNHLNSIETLYSNSSTFNRTKFRSGQASFLLSWKDSHVGSSEKKSSNRTRYLLKYSFQTRARE